MDLSLSETESIPKLKGTFSVLKFTPGESTFEVEIMVKNQRTLVVVDNKWLDCKEIQAKTKIFIVAQRAAGAFRVGFPENSLENNLFIVEPEILVSPQRIDKFIACPRKEIFSNYFVQQGTSMKRSELVVGKVIHAIVEEFLENKMKDLEKIKEAVFKTQASRITASDFTEAEIKKEVNTVLEGFIPFVIQTFGHKSDFKGNRFVQVKEKESSLVSFQFGIKGQVDLFLELAAGFAAKTVAMEIKTGNSFDYHMSHIQVMLYSLMLTQICDNMPGFSLVAYLRRQKMKIVEYNIKEVVTIIAKRNRIALNEANLNREPSNYRTLPEMPKRREICNSCPYTRFCNIHRENFEDFPENNKQFALTPLSKYHFNYFLSEINKLEANTEAKQSTMEVSAYSLVDFREGSIISVKKDFLNVESVRLDKLRVKYRDSFTFFTVKEAKISDESVTLYLEERLKPNKILQFELTSLEQFPFKLMRGNLFKLCSEEDSVQNKSLVKLKPQFFSSARAEEAEKQIEELFQLEYSSLSLKGKQALKKCLTAENFFCLNGKVEGELINVLELFLKIVSYRSQTVLISANKHKVLDKFLDKLANIGHSFMRVTDEKGCASKIKRFAINTGKERSEKRVRRFMESQLVGCPLDVIENYNLGYILSRK